MVTVKQGDTHDTTWTANMDLTDATVRLLARRTTVAPVEPDSVELAGVVTDAAGGVVTHTLDGTLIPGVYRVELEVTTSGGEVVTFPNDSYESLIVASDLG